MTKTITSIESFEKLSQDGPKGAIYECRLACGCLERHTYHEMEPEVGGWAECSCGIVDSYTRAFCTDAERAELKRALHDRSNPTVQTALAALLFAHRFEHTRYEESIRRRRDEGRRLHPTLRLGGIK